MVVQVLRCVDLLQVATRQHRDPVAHRHRLDLVVGDVHGGDVERVLELGDLGPHLHAQLGVEVRQRLVHQERLRLAHDRPAHRHPLALATRQLAGLAIEVLGELEDLAPRSSTRSLISSLGIFFSFSAKAMLSRTVRCGYSAYDWNTMAMSRSLGSRSLTTLVADAQLASRDRLEPGDHPQRGRLAAAGRPDEHEELAVGDVERQAGERRGTRCRTPCRSR